MSLVRIQREPTEAQVDGTVLSPIVFDITIFPRMLINSPDILALQTSGVGYPIVNGSHLE
jgi:hypothetical protein